MWWRGRQERSGYALARWSFLRALAVIFLVAFVSLWVQIDGLIGSRGILPAARFLEAVGKQLGPAEAWWRAPTLCWLNAGDEFLHGLCASGVALSVLLLLDVAPALCALGLWALYLSLVTVGQDFLSFQWDNLLLEAGLLAVFLAPLRLRPRHPAEDPPPSGAIVWLLRWLLFRLMLASGIVKLSSGDPAWRGLTALTYHYETQPLPTWMGWYAHQLPAWFQRASCLMVFVIEGLVPFFVFGARPWRQAACAAFVSFQLLIFLTGNYCFFNLLTIALCLFLLEDSAWPAWCRSGVRATSQPSHGHRWPRWIVGPVAAVTLLLGAMQLTSSFRLGLRWPRPLVALHRLASPFRSINPYGLFAVMTTARLEIILEGSADGSTWSAYAFRYKPGDLRRAPGFVEPHQPRLDWQMWFAALGSYRDNPWFLACCQRLLEGSPNVLALLAANPFPDAPPRYLRATVYNYHFTDAATRRAQGTWWSRTAQGLYCPVLSLRREAGG